MLTGQGHYGLQSRFVNDFIKKVLQQGQVEATAENRVTMETRY